MKKLILAAFALTAAASVFAQGTILFNTAEATCQFHIYQPLATSGANMYVSQMGNASNDKPVGTTVWSSYTVVGAAGLSGTFGGSDTMAELLAAPGQNQLISSLQPAEAGGITTFKTGTTLINGGIVAGTTASFSNIPDDYAAGATVELVAWDDSSGLYGTWALASAAWLKGSIAAGVSELANITATIGGTFAVPPTLPGSSNGENGLGLEAYNLYFIQVPEPATFALAGLGLATLLVFRHRK